MEAESAAEDLPKEVFNSEEDNAAPCRLLFTGVRESAALELPTAAFRPDSEGKCPCRLPPEPNVSFEPLVKRETWGFTVGFD
jgi:hypothetical protein